MSDIETDLPKVKKPVVKKAEKKDKTPAKAASKEKPKAVKSSKPSKPAKPVKADAKKAPAKKAAKVEKTAKAPAKKSGKATPNTVDAVSTTIHNYMQGAKPSSTKVDYSSEQSVIDNLAYKASTILLRAYSDKNIAAVTHGDSAVAKAAKAVMAKNAAAIRAEATAKHVKKMAGQIVKAAKSAAAGKLTASDYRAIAFEI